MAEWWEVGDTSFDLGGVDTSFYDPGYYSDYNLDFNFPDFSFDFQFPDFNFDMPDFNIPDINFGPMPDFSFDPGMYDLGFDPSFDLGQYEFDVGDPFALPQGDLDLPTLSLELGGGQPFDLFGAGAGSVPWLDFTPSIMADLTPGSLGDFGSTFPAFEPADLGISPLLASNVGLMPEYTASMGPTSLDFSEDLDLSRGTGPSRYLEANILGERPLPNDPSWMQKTPAEEVAEARDLDKDIRNRYYESQISHNKWQPWLVGGQLAAPALGGLLQTFGPGPKRPKPTALEEEAARANIEKTRAEIARLNALAEGSEGGGGGGGGMEAPEDPRLAIAEIQAQVAREQMAMEAETAEKLRRRPLMELDPRFSTLYDETTAAQQGLTPESPDIQSMTQQIYSVRMQGLEQEYARQRDQIIERANRLGHNPAAEMAQINEAEQKAKAALMVEAQQAALAFAQERLQPSTALLDAILKTVV